MKRRTLLCNRDKIQSLACSDQLRSRIGEDVEKEEESEREERMSAFDVKSEHRRKETMEDNSKEPSRDLEDHKEDKFRYSTKRYLVHTSSEKDKI